MGKTRLGAAIALVACVSACGGRQRSHPWRWITLGTAIVTAGAGAGLLAIDGHGSCDLAPGQTECPRVYNTKLIGIGVLLVSAGCEAAWAKMLFTADDTPVPPHDTWPPDTR